MIPDLPALSIKQPWAWMVVRPDLVDAAARAEAERLGLIKDLENRAWGPRMPGRPHDFRGRFLIHASLSCAPDDYSAACEFAAHLGVRVPPALELERGGIIGEGEVVDWVRFPASRWFMGPGALVLRNVKPLPFTACRGMLGFFKPQLAATSPVATAEPDLFAGLA